MISQSFAISNVLTTFVDRGVEVQRQSQYTTSFEVFATGKGSLKNQIHVGDDNDKMIANTILSGRFITAGLMINEGSD